MCCGAERRALIGEEKGRGPTASQPALEQQPEGRASTSLLGRSWGPTTSTEGCRSRWGCAIPYRRWRVHHSQVVAIEHGGAEGYQEGDGEQGAGEALGERRAAEPCSKHIAQPHRAPQ